MFAFRKLFKPSQLFRPVSLVIGLALGMQYTSRKSECCGIIGVVSTANNAEVVVAEGIKLLQNRGYDSAGIVTFHRETPDKIEANLTKYAIE